MSSASGLDSALTRVRGGLASMRNGNPDPYLACWAESDDATLCGAWGPIEQGYQRLAETFRWVGSQFRGGELAVENPVVHASGDLAYTVGFERGDVVIDEAGARRPMGSDQVGTRRCAP